MPALLLLELEWATVERRLLQMVFVIQTQSKKGALEAKKGDTWRGRTEKAGRRWSDCELDEEMIILHLS